jgi:hypothetical protein
LIFCFQESKSLASSYIFQNLYIYSYHSIRSFSSGIFFAISHLNCWLLFQSVFLFLICRMILVTISISVSQFPHFFNGNIIFGLPLHWITISHSFTCFLRKTSWLFCSSICLFLIAVFALILIAHMSSSTFFMTWNLSLTIFAFVNSALKMPSIVELISQHTSSILSLHSSFVLVAKNPTTSSHFNHGYMPINCPLLAFVRIVYTCPCISFSSIHNFPFSNSSDTHRHSLAIHSYIHVHPFICLSLPNSDTFECSIYLESVFEFIFHILPHVLSVILQSSMSLF